MKMAVAYPKHLGLLQPQHTLKLCVVFHLLCNGCSTPSTTGTCMSSSAATTPIVQVHTHTPRLYKMSSCSVTQVIVSLTVSLTVSLSILCHSLCHSTHCVTQHTVSLSIPCHSLCHSTHCVTQHTVSLNSLCHSAYCVTHCVTHCVTQCNSLEWYSGPFSVSLQWLGVG